MSRTEQIKTLQDSIAELGRIKDLLFEMEGRVTDIEKIVSEIDESSPSDKKVLNLIDQAYAIVDEILGPPKDDVTGEIAGTAFSPEARGTSVEGFSFDDIMSQLGSKKNNAN